MKMPKVSPETESRFRELLPHDPRVTVKKIFGQPGAFVDGNLFMGVFGDAIFVRLSRDAEPGPDRPTGARPFEPMAGRAMGGYCVLPVATIRSEREARRWIDRALEFAGGLPAKKRGK